MYIYIHVTLTLADACVAAFGEGFAASMRSAVEGVLGHVHEGDVSLRPSSAGKYISVTVGPVLVENGDQVRPACLPLFPVVCFPVLGLRLTPWGGSEGAQHICGDEGRRALEILHMTVGQYPALLLYHMHFSV